MGPATAVKGTHLWHASSITQPLQKSRFLTQMFLQIALTLQFSFDRYQYF